MKRSVLAVASLLAVLACAPAQRAGAVDLTLTNRSVSLTGKLTLAMVEKTAEKLIELDSISAEPIYLKINAEGDALEAAFALVDTVRAIRSPVVAVVQSRAYEAAAVLAVLCEKTYAYPNAVFLFTPVDKVSTELKPPKDPDEAFLHRFRADVYGTVAKAIGLAPGDYEAKIKDGWWLTAEEAVAAKVADGVVDGISFREIFLETTEVKTTVTTIEERQLPPVREEAAPDASKPTKRKTR